MGFRLQSAPGVVIANSTGSGGEQVFMQLGPIGPAAGSPVLLFYTISYVATAGALNVRISIRRGNGPAGVLILTLSDFVAVAGQLVERSGCMIDIPGADSGGSLYSLDVNNITSGTGTVFAENQF